MSCTDPYTHTATSQKQHCRAAVKRRCSVTCAPPVLADKIPKLTDPYTHTATSQKQHCRAVVERRCSVAYSPPVLEDNIPKLTDPYSNENIHTTLEDLKKKSAERIKRSQQAKCVELTAALVDFFGCQVISPNLSRRCGNWYHNVRNQLHLDNINVHRSELVQQVEEIAISKGLSKEQWQSLIYLSLSMGESECMNTATSEQLKEVRDMSSVLEEDDHKTVCALVDAIDKHVKKN
ncbi:unnamed protein product [Adineta steineri]|uniref:Uncharacterized protein n=1 Tax=Adineta steineri TaxID=433720 RepID=A0A819AGM2_9BILA|nr:unnamed protein product [Adineta steineri]CAF1409886.1 unnamed protein product [Adineta steineri]CAF3784251.1 unnamed protein product [Adineta steineri]CAF4020870.1 unnamed protein product [Adineta steineri]